MASIRKNFIFNATLTICGYIFPLMVIPYVSRVLGVANIGACNFVDSIVDYFTIVSMRGINTLGIREIAKAKSSQKELNKVFNLNLNYSKEVLEEAEIQIKYEGYIKKVEREADKMLKNEEKQIPLDIDYDKVPNLASEARQKLKEVRPLNIAQAIRISGVNPADISILLVYLRKFYNV